MNAPEALEPLVNMQSECRLTRAAARRLELEAKLAKKRKRDGPEGDAEPVPTDTAKLARGPGDPAVGPPVLTITGEDAGSLPEAIFGQPPRGGGNARTVTGANPAGLSSGVPGQRQALEAAGEPRVGALGEASRQRQASGPSVPPASEAGGEPRVGAPGEASGQQRASGSFLPPASEPRGAPRVDAPHEEALQHSTATSAGHPAGYSFIFGGAQAGNYSLNKFRAVTQGVAATPSSPVRGGLPPAWVVRGGGPTSPYNQRRPAPGLIPSYAAVHGAGEALARLPEGGGEARELARPLPNPTPRAPRNGLQPPQNLPNGAVGLTVEYPLPPAAQPQSRADVGGGPPPAQTGPAGGGRRAEQPVGRVDDGGAPPPAQSGPAVDGGRVAQLPPNLQPVTRARVVGQPEPTTALGPPDVALQFVRMFVDDPRLTVTVRFRAGATVREVKADRSRCGTQEISPDCLMLRTCIDGTVKVLEDFQAGREATLAEYGLLPREAPYNVYVFVTAPPPNARQERAAVAAVETSVGRPLPPGWQSSTFATHRTTTAVGPRPAPAPGPSSHPTAVRVPQPGQQITPPGAPATAAHLPQHGVAAPPAAAPRSGGAAAAADPAALPGAGSGGAAAAAYPAALPGAGSGGAAAAAYQAALRSASRGEATPGEAAGRMGTLPLQAAQRQHSGGDARRLSLGEADGNGNATDERVQRPPRRHTEPHSKRHFTIEETEALIRGVEARGVSDWMGILLKGGFQPWRTSVNLKDKWRNIENTARHPGRRQRGQSQLTPEQIDRVIRCLHVDPAHLAIDAART